jgi:hypothetical protein
MRMRKHLAIIILFLLSTTAHSETATLPDGPGDLCKDNSVCTPVMKQIESEFNKSELPKTIPEVSSGECYYISSMYDSKTRHSAVLLLDHTPAKEPAMAAILGYFMSDEEWRGWTVEIARKEMSPDWNSFGKLSFGKKSAVASVSNSDGSLGYMYWIREAKNHKMYMFLYGARLGYGLCRLNPHPK